MDNNGENSTLKLNFGVQNIEKNNLLKIQTQLVKFH